MRAFRIGMSRRMETLEAAEKDSLQKLRQLPEGRLRIDEKRGKSRYYHVFGQTAENGLYLGKDKIDLVRSLAQKQYLSNLLKSIRKEKKAIENYLRSYPSTSPEEVFAKLIPARKALVTPLFVEGEDYAKLWQAQPFEENPYLPEEKLFSTKRGEKVRSKSEAMIADTYFDMGIPYKYDYPVEVGNGKKKYVDFAVLDVRNKRVIYHEHLGRMDDPAYVCKNMTKLNEYRRIGIFTGKNLILTTEIDGCPLDMASFRKNTAELFGKALP